MGSEKNESGQGYLLCVVQTVWLALGFITHGPPSSFNKKPKITFPALVHTFGYLPTPHSANTYG